MYTVTVSPLKMYRSLSPAHLSVFLFFLCDLCHTNVFHQKAEEVELKPTDNIEMKKEPGLSTVSCKTGTRKDTGEYTITVTNKHGSDSATIEVVVLGE